MIVLKVILGIFSLLLLLLICPLYIFIEYKDTIEIKLRFLFFTYWLIPKKEELAKERNHKKQKETQKTPQKEKKSKIQDIIEKRGLSGFLELLEKAVNMAGGAAKKVFPHFIIKKLSLHIWVSDEDAAQTAIYYGYVCTGVYTAVGILLNHTNYKKYSIQIVPDFDAVTSRVEFSLKAHIKPVFLLAAGLGMLKNFILLQKKSAKPA